MVINNIKIFKVYKKLINKLSINYLKYNVLKSSENNLFE